MSQQVEKVEGLALYLGEIRIGVLVHYIGGAQCFVF
jgi:serine/threonine-protein kinase HipA